MEEREWRRGSGGEGVEEREWKRGSGGEGVEERVRCGVVEEVRGKQTGSQFSQMSTTAWYTELDVAC